MPELITQSAPGDLFVSRNVGNVVPAYGQMMGGVSTAIEYAVMALGVQHIVICGHSDCGAMKAVLDPAGLRAALTRLLADGAWFNADLGIPTVRDDERSVLRAIALQLVNEGDPQ